jgi:hypothetical protein
MARMLLSKHYLQKDGYKHKNYSNLYQEICTVNSRMYFDLDIPESENKDPGIVLKQFLKALRVHFLKVSDGTHRLLDKYIRVCKSTSAKVSYHISVINEIFPTPDHQVVFARSLENHILENSDYYNQLVWIENGKKQCAVDCNAYHMKQSVRMVLSRKDGKDNTLLPYNLLDNDMIELVKFDDYDYQNPQSTSNDELVNKLKEYFICVEMHENWSFTQFSKISNIKLKRGKKAVAYGKATNCDKKQLKQIGELMRNIPGFDLTKTQAVYDLDGNFVKYNIYRNSEEMCPCCEKKHARQNAVVQHVCGQWRYYCYHGNKTPVILAV